MLASDVFDAHIEIDIKVASAPRRTTSNSEHLRIAATTSPLIGCTRRTVMDQADCPVARHATNAVIADEDCACADGDVPLPARDKRLQPDSDSTADAEIVRNAI